MAKQYGLTAEDIDAAIRAWGAKATDPYEVGMEALYNAITLRQPPNWRILSSRENKNSKQTKEM